MTGYRRLFLFPTLLLAVALSGCVFFRPNNIPHVNSTKGLVDYLQGQGIGMIYNGPTTAAPFSEPAVEYQVNAGGILRIFEYNSSAAAVQDYAHIDQFRDPMRSPHVYYQDKLIVIYYGNHPLVQEKLTDVLGSPGV